MRDRNAVHFVAYADDAEGRLRRDTFVHNSRGCALFQTARRFRTEKEAHEFVLDEVREVLEQAETIKTGRRH